jgi:glycosyltransferase involved in cell wall biosynthesis
MAARQRFDFVHAHLSHDHWLARFVARDQQIRLARTFHSRRALRTDLFTRFVVSRTDAVFVINDAFRDAPLLRAHTPLFTPPPLDQRQFKPDGPDVRAQYGIAADEVVFAAIGKMSPGRGFEDVLRSFALIRGRQERARLLLIGQGEQRAALETMSRELRVDGSIVWAGYHEDDLAEHYRAADVLLFAATGSDQGHRAVIEAMGCGVPPAAFPLEGVDALFGGLSRALIAESATPQALSERGLQLAADRSLRRAVAARSAEFNFERSARRLIDAYQSAL